MRLGEGITNPRIIKSYEGLSERILNKHGSKYDYTESVFTHSKDKMKFICKRMRNTIPFYKLTYERSKNKILNHYNKPRLAP